MTTDAKFPSPSLSLSLSLFLSLSLSLSLALSQPGSCLYVGRGVSEKGDRESVHVGMSVAVCVQFCCCCSFFLSQNYYVGLHYD